MAVTVLYFELMPRKCSNLLPCAECVRRGQCCTYPTAQSRVVLIENGTHFTPRSMLSDCAVAPLCVRMNVRYFDRYFEAFATTNKFSCAASVWTQYLRTSVGRDPMLATAITAVGMLHAYKDTQLDSKDESLLKRALSTYQDAVTALRKSLSLAFMDVGVCSIMSATFLLGLFEVGDINSECVR